MIGEEKPGWELVQIETKENETKEYEVVVQGEDEIEILPEPVTVKVT